MRSTGHTFYTVTFKVGSLTCLVPLGYFVNVKGAIVVIIINIFIIIINKSFNFILYK